MRLLLDTQALLLLGTGGLDGFPPKARRFLRNPDTELLLSSISITELATKYAIGKLSVSDEDLRELIGDLRIDILPFTARHAARMFSLPLHHREPFDRMIIAVAIVERVPLVGADSKFPEDIQDGLDVLWK